MRQVSAIILVLEYPRYLYGMPAGFDLSIHWIQDYYSGCFHENLIGSYPPFVLVLFGSTRTTQITFKLLPYGGCTIAAAALCAGEHVVGIESFPPRIYCKYTRESRCR
jgi:hypothetical protein